MPVRYTSQIAYLSLLQGIPASRFKVWQCVMTWTGNKGPTIEDIAESTGMKESSVSGRVNELKADGLLVEGPLKTNRTGHPAMTYTAMAYMSEENLHKRQEEAQLALF